MNISKFVIAGLLASAATLGAQAANAQGAPTGGPQTTVPTPQTVPATPAPAETAPESQAAPAMPAAPAASANPQVVTFVDQQFPTADANKDGIVTAAEFTGWITNLKTAEQQKAGQVDPAAAKSYADDALAKADADKDGTLTKPELVTFFGG